MKKGGRKKGISKKIDKRLFVGILLIIVILIIITSFSGKFKEVFNIGESGRLKGELGSASLFEGDESRLIAHYEFEEMIGGRGGGRKTSGKTKTARKVLDSAGDNDGTVIGDARIFNDSERGNVLSLDGSGDYISIPHNENIDFDTGEDFSISLWFKSSIEVAGASTIIKKNKGGGLQNIFFEIRQDPYDDIRMQTGASERTVRSTITVDDGVWHHLVLIHNSDIDIGYLDGIAFENDTGHYTTSTNTEPWKIGTENFNGLIDDVKIWNYALPESKVLGEAGIVVVPGSETPGSELNVTRIKDIAGDRVTIYLQGSYVGDELTIIEELPIGSSLSSASVDPTQNNGNIITWIFNDSYHHSSVFTYYVNGNSNGITGTWALKDAGSQGVIQENDGCLDTDGGIEYFVRGSVIDALDTHEFYDYCTSNGLEVSSCIDSGANCGIIEKYCANNNRRSGNYLSGSNFLSTCLYGCQNGACLNESLVLEEIISHYEFNGNANDSFGNNHGSLINGANIISDPLKGEVLNLDGEGDYMDITGISTGANYTISAWIKTRPSFRQYRIFDSEFGKTVLAIDYRNGNFKFWNGVWWYYAINNPIHDGEWHLVTAIGTSDTLNLSVDGVNLFSESITTNPVGGTTIIGVAIEESGPGSRGFNGTIDDVMIFNRSLATSEILDIYNEQKPM